MNAFVCTLLSIVQINNNFFHLSGWLNVYREIFYKTGFVRWRIPCSQHKQDCTPDFIIAMKDWFSRGYRGASSWLIVKLDEACVTAWNIFISLGIRCWHVNINLPPHLSLYVWRHLVVGHVMIIVHRHCNNMGSLTCGAFDLNKDKTFHWKHTVDGVYCLHFPEL